MILGYKVNVSILSEPLSVPVEELDIFFEGTDAGVVPLSGHTGNDWVFRSDKWIPDDEIPLTRNSTLIRIGKEFYPFDSRDSARKFMLESFGMNVSFN